MMSGWSHREDDPEEELWSAINDKYMIQYIVCIVLFVILYILITIKRCHIHKHTSTICASIIVLLDKHWLKIVKIIIKLILICVINSQVSIKSVLCKKKRHPKSCNSLLVDYSPSFDTLKFKVWNLTASILKTKRDLLHFSLQLNQQTA